MGGADATAVSCPGESDIDAVSASVVLAFEPSSATTAGIAVTCSALTTVDDDRGAVDRPSAPVEEPAGVKRERSENGRAGCDAQPRALDPPASPSPSCMGSASKIHASGKTEPSLSSRPRRESVFRVHEHILPDAGRTLTADLRARIGGSECTYPILVDSGATHSVMDRTTFECLHRPEHPALSPVRVSFKGAFEGQPDSETIGLWSNVPVLIDDIEYRANFHVCPNTAVPVILGMDFLVEHRAEIKCGRRFSRVRLRAPSPDRSREVEGTIPNDSDPVGRIAVIMEPTRVSLGPYDQRFIGVRLVDTPITNRTMIFECITDVNSNVLIPPQLIHVDRGQATVYVENRSVEPTKLDARLLGCASEVGVGDATSRYPGVSAIYRPAARLHEGGRASEESKLPGSSPSVYGMIHELDMTLLKERIESGNHPKNRTVADSSRGKFSGGLDAVAKPSQESRVRVLGVAVEARHSETVNSGVGLGSRSGSAAEKESPDPISVCSVARAGGSPDLPCYLSDMLPPATVEATPAERAGLAALVGEYEDIFIKPGGEVGWTDRTSHVIDVGDAKPVKIPPRKTSFAEKELIEATVHDLLRSGKIRESHSPWASPIVLVKKKDGTMRFCIDYRRLNDATVKDAYPLPRIEDALDHLTGSRYYSTLDLASAYWQVAMDAASIDKTAFATHIGLYEWLVMPFGLSNAPATCERLMESLFQGEQWNGVLVYLDDLVAYGDTWSSALSRTRLIFQQLREANLKLKPTKCFLMRDEVEYLGHRVTTHGISPGEPKVKAIQHWPRPRSIDEVRSFLGLTGYYRKFVKDYADVAVPLVAMLKKGTKYHWDEAQQKAFDTLRQSLMEFPCLGIIKPCGRLILDTDASDYALGAVLSQIQDGKERVLGYYSKSLNPAQTRYCTTKKELLAVKAGLENWDHYLQNPSEPFLIRTDHAALKWLTSMSSHDRTLLRWATFVSEYQYECEHRPGRHHLNADALSRVQFRPCGYTDCTDCLPGSTTFAFSEGEEVRLREDSELVIDPPESKTSFLVAVVTRSQTANQTQTPNLKPDNPAFHTRSRARKESAAATGVGDGSLRAPGVERSELSPPIENGKYSGSDSAQPLPVSSKQSSGSKGDERTEDPSRKSWVEESLVLPDQQPPQEIGGECQDDAYVSPRCGGTGLSACEREAVGVPPFDEATCLKEITEWARKDWAVAQRSCPVLSRVLVYVQENRAPRPEELVRESREVRLLLTSLPLFELRDAILMYRTPIQPQRPVEKRLE